jgi:hypothetical protein
MSWARRGASVSLVHNTESKSKQRGSSSIHEVWAGQAAGADATSTLWFLSDWHTCWRSNDNYIHNFVCVQVKGCLIWSQGRINKNNSDFSPFPQSYLRHTLFTMLWTIDSLISDYKTSIEKFPKALNPQLFSSFTFHFLLTSFSSEVHSEPDWIYLCHRLLARTMPRLPTRLSRENEFAREIVQSYSFYKFYCFLCNFWISSTMHFISNLSRISFPVPSIGEIPNIDLRNLFYLILLLKSFGSTFSPYQSIYCYTKHCTPLFHGYED